MAGLMEWRARPPARSAARATGETGSPQRAPEAARDVCEPRSLGAPHSGGTDCGALFHNFTPTLGGGTTLRFFLVT